jgi:catechol 2,3-dioxygenase-like lactoylglutathione lyase family enzyme
MKNAVGAMTLFVADKERAKEFYARAFAAEPLFEDDTSAAFRFDNTILNLVVDPGELIEPAPVGSGTTAMYTVFVDDCDAAVELVRSRGVELLNGPVDRPWGVRTAAFADPDGHAWELAQDLSS